MNAAAVTHTFVADVHAVYDVRITSKKAEEKSILEANLDLSRSLASDFADL